MRHYAKPPRATLTALLMLVAIARTVMVNRAIAADIVAAAH
jgi:hypothetical protein